jgi:nicotinamide riboside transporter PnuC
LFVVQKMWGMAILSALLTVIAVAGYITWRRRYREQGIAAVPA